MNKWMSEVRVPNVSISIISNMRVVSEKTYSSLSGDLDKTDNVSFELGSISKTITSWGICRLAEQGMIDLDDPMSKYLTYIDFIDLSRVTVRMALSHTSGLAPVGYLGYRLHQSLPSVTESLKGAGNTALTQTAEPGGNFCYSGSNYTLLQLLIETLTGTSFEEYMKHQILHPLGMLNSTFDRNELAMMPSYNVLGFKSKELHYTEKAAAGLCSSINDFSKFLLANMYHSNSKHMPISDKSLTMMHSRVNRRIPYGLGYYIFTLPNNIKMIMHSGMNIGWYANFIVLPELGEGIVVMTNSNYGQILSVKIVKHWLEELTGPLSQKNLDLLKLNPVSKSSVLFKGLMYLNSRKNVVLL